MELSSSQDKTVTAISISVYVCLSCNVVWMSIKNKCYCCNKTYTFHLIKLMIVTTTTDSVSPIRLLTGILITDMNKIVKTI